VAHEWGRIVARAQTAGHPMSTMDAFIAAVAESRDLALVTRDEGDFAGLGRPLINPWRAGG